MSVNVGVIGTARRAAAHLKSLAQIEEVEITALCDVAEDRVRQAAEQYGGRVYMDYREMLDRETLDVVYIVTPPRVHADPAIQAAERGIHVFLEKPLALSMGEAIQAKDTVERAGVFCAIGYQLRYLDIMDRAKALLGGRPVVMVAGHYYWTVPPITWVMDRRQTGGQIVEQATHLVDLCRFFVGEVHSVYGRYTLQTRQDVPGFHNWDANCVTMTFESGAVGSMVSTYALFPGIPDNSSVDIVADEVLVRVSGSELRVFTREGTEVFKPEVDPTLEANRAFIHAVVTGDPSGIRSPIEDGLRTLAVTLAANHSHKTGQPVDMATFLT